MPIELKMPALSPTMEEGTLARWLVKAGDTVKSGDILAEIETDKATMEFEAIDEGTIAEVLVPEGSEGVKVGTVIATITGEDEASGLTPAAAQPAPSAGGRDVGSAEQASMQVEVEQDLTAERGYGASPATDPKESALKTEAGAPAAADEQGERVKASPLARRIAAERGVDLAGLAGTGPGGRIVRADVEGAAEGTAGLRPSDELRTQPSRVENVPLPGTVRPEPVAGQSSPAVEPAAPFATDIPHELVKLSGMRKTIARRLTEAKATIPHIYLTVDVRLDALLKLRGELNAALAGQGVKLSVNDLLIRALAKALALVPACNVSFTTDQLVQYQRADIAVAVSIPGGLITPIIVDAGSKSVSAISTEMAALAARAKDGKLQPHEYQGGTASISNMGMMGIKQFAAVINPPQAVILAIGAGEKRPVVDGDALAIATVMTVTGSFDHRAIDGADGALLLKAFQELCEAPLALVA